MSVMEKEQKNSLESIQQTEGKMSDDRGSQNNFNEFSELSVSYIYACLQLLI